MAAAVASAEATVELRIRHVVPKHAKHHKRLPSTGNVGQAEELGIIEGNFAECSLAALVSLFPPVHVQVSCIHTYIAHTHIQVFMYVFCFFSLPR